jgi:hypothetical protein
MNKQQDIMNALEQINTKKVLADALKRSHYDYIRDIAADSDASQ